MDTAVSVGALLAMAYFLGGLRKESVLQPSMSLPIQSTPDVRRWRHDGTQPKADHIGGNMFPSVNWPEVDELLS